MKIIEEVLLLHAALTACRSAGTAGPSGADGRKLRCTCQGARASHRDLVRETAEMKGKTLGVALRPVSDRQKQKKKKCIFSKK